MRKIYLLMALCFSFAITSCGDKNEDETLIVDYAPVEFYISVENKYGVDLLNSENGHTIISLNGLCLILKDTHRCATL